MEWETPPPLRPTSLFVTLACRGKLQRRDVVSNRDGVNRPFQVFWPNASVSFHAKSACKAHAGLRNKEQSSEALPLDRSHPGRRCRLDLSGTDTWLAPGSFRYPCIPSLGAGRPSQPITARRCLKIHIAERPWRLASLLGNYTFTVYGTHISLSPFSFPRPPPRFSLLS